MNNFAQFGSHLSDQHQGQQTGASGGRTGSTGQTDYLDKGISGRNFVLKTAG
jgi:hypothetical protein